MTNPEWSYLQNPFDNVTKKNFKRMYIMATDHFDKLQKQAATQTEIAELLTDAKPHYDAFVQQYIKSSTDSANYQMHTATIENLLQQLSGELIRQWDVRIQVKFDIKSPQYKALLPNGRNPFQSGAYDMRISQVRSLANRLLQFPQLAGLKNDVLEFSETLLAARTAQQGEENTHQTNSDDLENTRKTLATAMHRTFGKLIGHYAENITKVETFYELKYLRRGSIDNNEGDVLFSEEIVLPPVGTISVLEGRFGTDDSLLITNQGPLAITALLAFSESAADMNNATIIEVGQSAVLKAGSVDRVLILHNSGDMEGLAKVEVL